MKIEIFGIGCPKCKKTYQVVAEQVERLGIRAEISRLEDAKDLAAKGVTMTPTVKINRKIKIEGKVPSREQVAEWLKQESL